MKRYSVIITLALLAMLMGAQTVQAAAPSTSFSGTWVGYDVPPSLGGDGSTQHLVVKGGSSPQVNYQDEFGQACWDAGATDFWFNSTLKGSVSGSTMTGTFMRARCGHTSLSAAFKGQTMSWVFNGHGTANPADDTLWDGVVTWSRV